MGDDAAAASDRVWLYEGGEWQLAADPIDWGAESADVRARYAEAGYTESSIKQAGKQADPFLVFGLHSEEARPAGQLSLFVRHDPPQCLIDIEGPAGSTRTVYVARFPDALDLMARWAPIAQAAALTALVEDLIAFDGRHNPARADGLLESVVRRVGRALP